MKLFLSQPVDGVPVARLRATTDEISGLLDAAGVEIVAPYAEDDFDLCSMTKIDAARVVDADLSALSNCDAFLAVLSTEKRQAVGMIFEMAHAVSLGIPVIVYVGDSSLGDRIWIKAKANHICRTWSEVDAALSAQLRSPS